MVNQFKYELSMCIIESRVSYTIYNSRTAGSILMIPNLLDSSPPLIVELLFKYRKNSSKKNNRKLIIVLPLLQYIFS